MAIDYTEEQLNKLDKDFLIQLLLNMQEQLKHNNQELHDLNEKMQLLMEQVVLGKKARFGRSSEKLSAENQISFMEVDGTIVFFNEAEAVSDLSIAEPEDLVEPVPKKKRTAGKKEEAISGIPENIVPHYLSNEELIQEFGENGWKTLPDAIMKQYHFTPAKITVDVHHIGVYASKETGRMLKAPHPPALLHGSLVSPSIAAAIINGKYVNAVPLYRLEQEFARNGLQIPRRNMANWMIRIAEEYLSVLYDYLHEKLLEHHVIQADETTVEVTKDGRSAGTKSYMWVYRNGVLYNDKHIVLYEYQLTRNGEHAINFLKNFEGICVTDGYQVYHTAEKQIETLRIAGCWVHCRRHFNDALVLIKSEFQKESIAYLIMKQIQAIYREEGKLKELSSEERLKQRQLVVKPLVDAFFLHLNQTKERIPKSGALREAYNYALNQEKYLKVFLTDGDVPIDNNASERAIRGFCIGRKNWMMIDSINGAKSSAIIYSIVETAKANNLKPYEYVHHLLTEIPRHMEKSDRSFLEELMPWSPTLPEAIRKPIK